VNASLLYFVFSAIASHDVLVTKQKREYEILC